MMYVDKEWIPIVFFTMIPVTAIGVTMARAWARKLDRAPAQPALPAEAMARLERMEQAIDSIAIEVERISEAQRFTTKLLSERGSPPQLGSPTS